MEKYLIINRCHTDNLGDRIIGHTMNMLFKRMQIEVFQADYVFSPNINNDASMISRIMYVYKCIKKIKKCNKVIIGGGELLSSTKSFFGAFVRWNRLMRRYNPNAEKYLFSVGVQGPFDAAQIKYIQETLKGYKGIYLRDHKSIQLINTITNDAISHKIHYIPDCVFNIYSNNEAPKEELALFSLTGLKRHNKHGYIRFDSDVDLYEYYYNLLETIKRRYQCSIKLFYNTKDDKSAVYGFKEYISEKYHMVIPIIDIEDEETLISIISKSKVLVSPRMHACILGLVYGADLIPIRLSEKMNDFCDLYCDKSVNIDDLRSVINEGVNSIVYGEKQHF